MQYQNAQRGNRLYPRRTSRIYWALTSLRKVLEQILESGNLDFSNVLDFGCGNKPYFPLFSKYIEKYIGADLIGNPEADIIINADGTLPVDSSKFSSVLSSQVLEHVEDPILYLKESCRVLKNEGKLILSTHGYWQYHPDPNDYWRWTSAGLKKIVEQSGFNIENLYSIQSFPSMSLQLWQDATMYKIPRIFRSTYVYFIQVLMEIIDRKNGNRFSDNAAIFIIVAKKK